MLKKVRNSRHMRVLVHGDGRVVATAPYRATYGAMERFLFSREDWIKKALSKFASHKTILPGGGVAHYKKHKGQAREFVLDRLEHFNQFYNFKYNRVSIRNQKSRWGSCSKKGNLNFNYKIIFLRPEQAGYIIAHELCHLRELNHSKKFWDLVSAAIPCYKEIRRKLRKLVL